MFRRIKVVQERMQPRSLSNAYRKELELQAKEMLEDGISQRLTQTVPLKADLFGCGEISSRPDVSVLTLNSSTKRSFYHVLYLDVNIL